MWISCIWKCWEISTCFWSSRSGQTADDITTISGHYVRRAEAHVDLVKEMMCRLTLPAAESHAVEPQRTPNSHRIEIKHVSVSWDTILHCNVERFHISLITLQISPLLLEALTSPLISLFSLDMNNRSGWWCRAVCSSFMMDFVDSISQYRHCILSSF